MLLTGQGKIINMLLNDVDPLNKIILFSKFIPDCKVYTKVVFRGCPNRGVVIKVVIKTKPHIKIFKNLEFRIDLEIHSYTAPVSDPRVKK